MCSYRVDVARLTLGGLDPLAKTRHRVVDRACERRVEITPDRAQQFVAIDDAGAPLRNVAQKVELKIGQVDGDPTPCGTRRAEVDLNLAAREPRRLGARPAQNGVNARDQLLEIEGLRKIIVGTET
jgi:hypothetical protein